MADSHEAYRETLREQIKLRDDNSPAIDKDAIKEILQSKQDTVNGELLFLAASDFGQPYAFVPERIDDGRVALNVLLDQVHRDRRYDGKWGAENTNLRSIKEKIVSSTEGIHKALPAILYENGDVEYDITEGDEEEYNFVTIRQVAGLVDWCANSYQADDQITMF